MYLCKTSGISYFHTVGGNSNDAIEPYNLYIYFLCILPRMLINLGKNCNKNYARSYFSEDKFVAQEICLRWDRCFTVKLCYFLE